MTGSEEEVRELPYQTGLERVKVRRRKVTMKWRVAELGY